jgi:hypothetical protein
VGESAGVDAQATGLRGAWPTGPSASTGTRSPDSTATGTRAGSGPATAAGRRDDGRWRQCRWRDVRD